VWMWAQSTVFPKDLVMVWANAIDWSLADGDTIVWGTMSLDGDTIVWGTNIGVDGDTIVWGTTVDPGTAVLWGTSQRTQMAGVQ